MSEDERMKLLDEVAKDIALTNEIWDLTVSELTKASAASV